MSNLPDWLKSEPPAGKSFKQGAPDWLTAGAPGQSVRQTALPDWLSAVAQGGTPTPSSKPAQPPAPISEEPEETSPAAPAASDDLFEAMRAETPTPPAEDALPDFLAKSSSKSDGTDELPDLFGVETEKSADLSASADVPDWMTSEAEEPDAEPALSASVDVPDWLKDEAGDKPAEPESPKVDVPDWLSGEADKAPAEPAPSASADVPDWLKDEAGDIPAEPEKAAASGDAPDWLSSLDAPPPPSVDARAPDWLSSLDAPPPAGSAADAPDWLSAVDDSRPEAEASTSEPEPTPAAPSPTAADTPDWLNQIARDETPPPAEAAPTPAASPAGTDMPNWLNKIAGDEAPPAPAAPAPSPAGTDAPDWLNKIAEGEPPASPAAPSPAGADVPDWLNQIAGGDAPPPDAPASTPEASPAGDAPDWLNKIAAGEPPASPAAPPTAEADVPDWLNQIAGGDAPAPEASAPTPPAGDILSVSSSKDAPDWLNAVADSAPPAESAPAEAAPAPSEPTPLDLPPLEPAAVGTGEDLLDWMSGPEFNIGDPGAVPPPQGGSEDLLGLTDDLMMSAESAPADDALEPSAAVAGDLPEWLRGLKPTSDTDIERPLTPSASSELTEEDLGEIGNLRFEKIIGDAERADAGGPEKVGALKDVAGAIRPELVFDAQSLKAGKIVGESILTKEQERRILLLEDLLLKQTGEVAVTRGRAGRFPIERWLIALILIAAVVVPMALGFKLLDTPGAPSSEVSDAKDAVENLPANAKVLMAFEYEPDTAPEMDTLAGVLLKHIATRDGVMVVAVSTRPFGPHLADRALRRAGTVGGINLGYVSGGSIGVSGLTVGNVQGSPFGTDLIGRSSDLEARTLKELAPSLIVVLSAGGEDVRTWVEQAGKPTGIPMLAATSASGGPLAVPYRQSGQLVAVISGVNDAEAYRVATDQEEDPTQTATWNAQAIGGLAAALLIVAGGILYGLMAMREQQEQNA